MSSCQQGWCSLEPLPLAAVPLQRGWEAAKVVLKGVKGPYVDQDHPGFTLVF